MESEYPTPYPAGTRAATVLTFQGSYVDMLKWYPTIDANNEEVWRRYIKRVYNQPTWYWTGYRWLPITDSSYREVARDKARAKAGRKVVNNEWST